MGGLFDMGLFVVVAAQIADPNQPLAITPAMIALVVSLNAPGSAGVVPGVAAAIANMSPNATGPLDAIPSVAEAIALALFETIQSTVRP